MADRFLQEGHPWRIRFDSLAMMRPQLILVSGLPGSGKSFFAEKLAAKIGASYVSSDRVRTAIDLRGKYSPLDKRAVYKKMHEQAKYLLRERQSVVVDATFHLAVNRDLFLNLAEKKSISVFCFEIGAKEDLIGERLSKKRLESEADFKVYEALKKEFEPWTTPLKKLQSTQDNILLMLDEALEYLEDENV